MSAVLMRAARLHAATKSLRVEHVPVPEPGAGEVRVRVKACGICGTDVSLAAGHVPAGAPVLTLGHEAAGVIDALGADVPAPWRPGQAVVLSAGRACGECRPCADGDPGACRQPRVLGVHVDGAFAEYVVVPHRSLVAVPDTRPFEEWAILADAVATPYAALVDTGGFTAGNRVGVWGAGGLGVHAIQIARALGAAAIVALDPRAPARERALACGADAALDPGAPDAVERVASLTSDRGLDVAADFVGANATVTQALRTLGEGGRVVIAGVSGDDLSLGAAAKFVVRQRRLLGHFGYARRHLEAVVDMVAAGALDVSRSVSGVLPLDDIADGLARLADKTNDPIRLVVRP
jgi:threonine dehydrogenase-like Zn-dependent dehydrogenase